MRIGKGKRIGSIYVFREGGRREREGEACNLQVN